MYGKLFGALALALSVTATPLSINPKRDGANRAAYFLDNNPAGTSIVSLKISEDGYLSSPSRISTGGYGLYGIDSGGDAGPDSLFAQDSVVVEQNYLFTVNVGSKTLAMFFIDDEDPWHPTLVGSPADTLGDFPMSVAYCAKLKTVCVMNGGAIAGVTCFATDHAKGLTLLDKATRPIALGQTTPPFGPTGTTSDLFFNPSCTALFATVKSNPPAAGTFYIWPVVNGKVSATAKTQQIADMLVIFGSVFEGSDSTLLVTDAAYGASILHVAPDFTLTETAHTVIPGQVAICWGTYSSRFNSAYIFDVANTNITVLDPVTGAVKDKIIMDPSAKGAFDNAIDRSWLYVIGGDASVEVISLLGENHGDTPNQVQKLDLSAIGSRKGWQGFAIYPSS